MIELVEFHNFKALRDARLPLGRFTMIVGPNGSGKSTAMQALRVASNPDAILLQQVVTAGQLITGTAIVQVVLQWGIPYEGITTTAEWDRENHGGRLSHLQQSGVKALSNRGETLAFFIEASLATIRVYTLHAAAIIEPVFLSPQMVLQEDGGGLAGVLDRLRDNEPERFAALNDELGRWLPEFDQILFDTPERGKRAFLLRTREGHHKIPAYDLSHGTLFALTLLTLAYLPEPPPLICLEEPDHGMHPRLLRHVQDALYRLSYPESFGETRQPVQVLATTHSPYFLDLFRDHPEEIVIAHKVGQEARFERLSDRPDIEEILGDAPLGEIWYSGILGGVPAE